LASVEQYRVSHHLPVVHRRRSARSLQYQVVDGARFDAVLPHASTLVARVHSQLEEICGTTLALIDDVQAARNINVTPPGGQYRWHYDRNLVTALVYLNSIEGGETELYPNYRLQVPGGRPFSLQHALDQLLLAQPVRSLVSRPVTIAPTAGTFLALRGSRTLHSVRPVEGNRERVNLVLAFDRPGAARTRRRLNAYLYVPGSGPDIDSVPQPESVA
jgi:hypothetical protein